MFSTDFRILNVVPGQLFVYIKVYGNLPHICSQPSLWFHTSFLCTYYKMKLRISGKIKVTNISIVAEMIKP